MFTLGYLRLITGFAVDDIFTFWLAISEIIKEIN